MQEVTKYPHGTFSWVDIATTDTEGAKAFYSGLFGWEMIDIPAGDSMSYTMCQLEGRNVAGMGGLNPEQQAQGIPPHWSSYVSVDDIESTTAKAAELGGTIFMPPFDIFDSGRMSMIQDPTGAVFCLWEAKNHIGAQLVNMPNTLAWNELATRDSQRATDFYTNLFGWNAANEQNALGGNYIVLSNNERMAGGILQMTEEWGDIPPHWMPYFAVENCHTTVEQAQALGGNIRVPPVEIPNMGTFSVIQDPQGAVFSIMAFIGPMDPPPGY